MATVIKSFKVSTTGKGTYEVSDRVAAIVAESGVADGVVTIFVQHTSASLILMENADPSARVDLEEFFDRLVPEGEPYFTHTYEGGDDMPSHIRMVLTNSSEVIPFQDGMLMLGTWQGLFLFEHRRASHVRHLVVVVRGD